MARDDTPESSLSSMSTSNADEEELPDAAAAALEEESLQPPAKRLKRAAAEEDDDEEMDVEAMDEDGDDAHSEEEEEEDDEGVLDNADDDEDLPDAASVKVEAEADGDEEEDAGREGEEEDEDEEEGREADGAASAGGGGGASGAPRGAGAAADIDGMSDVSSDTSGSVPMTPVGIYTAAASSSRRGDSHHHFPPHHEADDDAEQVTTCVWEGCDAGDLGDMDRLVEHVHGEHIDTQSRHKKFTCEWVGCPRKGMAHASGYALKAHLRSHTREKPFFCVLPECDRSYTRSDALAKHMRMVHETEALRPSDPVPKSVLKERAMMAAAPASLGPHATGTTTGLFGTGVSGYAPAAAGVAGTAPKGRQLKIILKTPQSHAAGQEDAEVDDDGDEGSAGGAVGGGSMFFTPLTADQGFDAEELAMPLPRLFRRLRRFVQWAEDEKAELDGEARRVEEAYRLEWLEKEVLLDQAVQSNLDYTRRRDAVLSGQADLQLRGITGGGGAKEVAEEASPEDGDKSARGESYDADRADASSPPAPPVPEAPPVLP